MPEPTGVPPARPTARQPPLHFAGRKQELADFAGMFEDARRSGRPPGGLVLVDGVQGIGKTQLVKHFHAFLCAKAKEIEAQRAREARLADAAPNTG